MCYHHNKNNNSSYVSIDSGNGKKPTSWKHIPWTNAHWHGYASSHPYKLKYNKTKYINRKPKKKFLNI